MDTKTKGQLRRDQLFVELFLRGRNESTGSMYVVREWSDQVQSLEQAVEAVACDESGRSLAIEHTLLQPFEGQKEDDQPFLAVFCGLENDAALVVPNCMIDLYPRVGAVPRGIKWGEAGPSVREWFRTARHSLPEGLSEHTVPGLPFPLKLHVEKTSMPGYPGKVFADRPLPLDRPLVDVVRKALRAKLPKLVAAAADERILLLEKGTTARGYGEVGGTIESVKQEFPELGNVDEIWVVNTLAMESERTVLFARVWPGCLGDRFWVQC